MSATPHQSIDDELLLMTHKLIVDAQQEALTNTERKGLDTNFVAQLKQYLSDAIGPDYTDEQCPDEPDMVDARNWEKKVLRSKLGIQENHA